MALRVLLAEDSPAVRESFLSILARRDDIDVIGEAEDGAVAVNMAGQLAPDVVVLDADMPDAGGIAAACQIAARFPAVRVLAVSLRADKRFVARARRAGAHGYMLKDGAFGELAEAIWAVAADKRYLSPQIAGVEVELQRPRNGSNAT